MGLDKCIGHVSIIVSYRVFHCLQNPVVCLFIPTSHPQIWQPLIFLLSPHVSFLSCHFWLCWMVTNRLLETDLHCFPSFLLCHSIFSIWVVVLCHHRLFESKFIFRASTSSMKQALISTLGPKQEIIPSSYGLHGPLSVLSAGHWALFTFYCSCLCPYLI